MPWRVACLQGEEKTQQQQAPRSTCKQLAAPAAGAMALRDSSGQVLGGTARLAVEGEEWRPGRDYKILSKIGGSAAGVIGGGEGCESIVFKIRRLRQPVVAADEPAPGTASDELYALKQVIHFDQMREHEADEELWARHGAEWRVMMQLPPHECLLPVLHHYHSDVPSWPVLTPGQ